ncbi:hypothetical protein QKU48_gp1405 [Fadolivirus algeromassiliense]|jgi:hypothetical protein|uniref:Uncharacterized protein n=1 Tax=Fadolivirus FV1/VV64 TaxID=3070911 RepID=A0A7D3QVF1_9VIRU|nr:hypothetical protein QKU48_gp1405 [Fadolivirus algeromassiliense]QKF94863.1 hypothetical protein Fadolivirus_1_1405 [Fadolivirus FV1/VV64]
MDKPKTRYFKLISEDGTSHGRFSGSKPKQAANKAFTKIVQENHMNGNNIENTEVEFGIIESTRCCKHKTYKYIGKRVKLDKPMEVVIGNGPDKKIIQYHYSNVIKKANHLDKKENSIENSDIENNDLVNELVDGVIKISI